jgi:GMP synthase (glutamine-hydrolysing)
VHVLAIVHQVDAGPGVFAEGTGHGLERWLPAQDPLPPRPPGDYDAVITLGGAMHVDQEREHPWLVREKEVLRGLLGSEVPLLGVCLGAQLLAEVAGADVGRARRPEIGWFDVRTTEEASGDPLLGPLAPGFPAFEWHSYEFALPLGATPLARSERCLQAFRIGAVAWGIQFHAEVARSDLESWIDDYRSDPDAVAVDAEALRNESRARIDEWNELGRELCGRFLKVAASD